MIKSSDFYRNPDVNLDFENKQNNEEYIEFNYDISKQNNKVYKELKGNGVGERTTASSFNYDMSIQLN